MRNERVVILSICLIVVSAVIGINLGRIHYGPAPIVEQFKSMGITTYYGEPSRRLYDFKCNLVDKDNFFSFVEKYDIKEVWIKRGIPPYYYCIKDEVMYYW